MNNKVLRCQCRNITNNKICANRSKNMYLIKNKRHCTFHYNYYRYNYTIIIQKYYRGYKTRRLLNNIYKKLPDDIQDIISYYIREDFHYKKYITILKKIINKKLYEWDRQYWYTAGWGDEILINTIEERFTEINYHYNLFNKYKTIIEDNTINKMHIFGKKIKQSIYNYTSLQDYTSLVNRTLNLLYYKIDYCLDTNTILSSES